jgi:AcrR family transcriptional regulator
MAENNVSDARPGTPERLAQVDALHQGLRERKKALMRQLISDTATVMFLERGFDEVRVSEIAAACDVSEKTIYNYFPTKESLLLDREEDSTSAIRKALGPEGDPVSPVTAMVGILKGELQEFMSHINEHEQVQFSMIGDFNDLIESTPSLKAARADMIDRLAQVAAESMAARAGVDPERPRAPDRGRRPHESVEDLLPLDRQILKWRTLSGRDWSSGSERRRARSASA